MGIRPSLGVESCVLREVLCVEANNRSGALRSALPLWLLRAKGSEDTIRKRAST